MSTTTLTSELDAVNIILAALGATPLNSLTNVTAADAAMAIRTLNEVSKAVQTKGWRFNTETAFKLFPTIPSKEIHAPNNCVSLETVDGDASRDVIVRGQRLYDRTNQTFEFSQPLTVEMVLLLPFSDLPEAARRYITIRAARVQQDRTVGSEVLFKFNALDEQEAHRDFRRSEGLTANYNILNGSNSVSRTLNR